MKLFLISQSVNNGYDTYDSAVVAAESEDAARLTHPCTYSEYTWGKWHTYRGSETEWGCAAEPYDYAHSGDWTTPDHVIAEEIGTTTREAGVICSSFNAG